MPSELAEGRSILYQWFSQLFLDEPTAKNLNLLNEPLTVRTLLDLFGEDEAGKKFVSSLAEWKKDKGYRSQLMLDYQDLMKVPGSKYVLPYESCYREKLIDGSLGTVYGSSTMQVQDLYQQAKAPITKVELPDHFGVELSFMHYLSGYEAWQLKHENQSFVSKLRSWQIGFLTDHILVWSQELLTNVEGKAETSYYQSIARLCQQFLKEDVRTIKTLDLGMK